MHLKVCARTGGRDEKVDSVGEGGWDDIAIFSLYRGKFVVS
jgi:hypothetical protein